jgi:predicted RNA-binding Zn-ribbon protein involved in translation (DUF1610 family)
MERRQATIPPRAGCRSMSSYGSKIVCPSCGGEHIVRVGEVKTHRQIEFVCAQCGNAISLAPDAVEAAPKPQRPDPDPPSKFEGKLVD